MYRLSLLVFSILNRVTYIYNVHTPNLFIILAMTPTIQVKTVFICNKSVKYNKTRQKHKSVL